VRRSILAAAATLPLVLAAACSTAAPTASGGGQSKQHGKPIVVESGQPPPPKPSDITITPATGTLDSTPDRGIGVTIAHGRLTRVTVSSPAGPVAGTLASSTKSWHTTWALGVSESYTVTATGVDRHGKVVTATSSFRTFTPAQTFTAEIFEGYQVAYGVGIPIQVDFNRPITNEATVERSLQIRTSVPVVGAWYWNGNEQVDFRPRVYWQPGTTVTFVGHLDGVQGAPGVYGHHTLTQTFVIGRSLIVVASTASHFMDVYLNDHLLYHWPISTGRPGDNTPDGTYLTLDKANPQRMVGPGYDLEVPWSVRITLSGDFLHDAYWSVGEQGFTNVSHGCVNMAPADAEIYYKMAVFGDPVTITGSPRGGRFGNGWTYWFLTWSQLVDGSALHEAVVAGPNGSRFVNPATLPASHAVPPLQTSAPGNSLAA
jgi:lipoprotein-anchoring transpeptidase ErfK/SrfK